MTDAPGRPTVSVVIPCFNQARFLAAAVASVLGQSYACHECIVVNDGSTDDTAAVASSLGVQLIEQSNRGVSEARNTGLAASHGELVVFLDADDELLPDAVAEGVRVLASNPAAAAVVGRCQAIDSGGQPLPATYRTIDPSNLYPEWLSNNFVWTPGAAMFRKHPLAEMGGFPAGLGPAADYAVYLRFARSGRIRPIPQELVRYRQHDANMSRDPALMLSATLEVLRRERLEAPATARPHIRRGRQHWCDWYGEQIVHRLRTDWRQGRRGRVQFQAAITLVRHCPAVALRHAARKTNRTLMQLLGSRGRRVAR
jgi:glycosyltransferase involved in cell wall biosynthesis